LLTEFKIIKNKNKMKLSYTSQAIQKPCSLMNGGRKLEEQDNVLPICMNQVRHTSGTHD
jgi:hypothetical protein